MTIRAAAVVVASLCGAVPALYAAQGGSPELVVTVSPQLAQPGQTITVTLTNNSASTWVLPSSCLFASVHPKACDADPIAAFNCLTALTPIAPGQTYTQTWDQTDQLGAQVADGGYTFPIVLSGPGAAKAEFCPFVQLGLTCSVPPNQYGVGGAGSGGLVPAIFAQGGSGYPQLGNAVFEVGMSNGLGSAHAVFFVGFGPAAIRVNWGTFLIDPSLPLLFVPVQLQGNPGVPGEGSFPLNVPIPNTPGLAGLEVYFQVLIGDPGATGGIAHTPGLRAVICQ